MSALKYRDRASERRIKYGQSDKPVLAKKAKKREKMNESRDEEDLSYPVAATSLLGRVQGWQKGILSVLSSVCFMQSSLAIRHCRSHNI